jgi:fatty acid/phospholipid biosynthesis enzyme
LDGIAIVAHGAATSRAVAGAISLARKYEALKLVDSVRLALEEAIPEEHANTSELPITRSSGPYDRLE